MLGVDTFDSKHFYGIFAEYLRDDEKLLFFKQLVLRNHSVHLRRVFLLRVVKNLFVKIFFVRMY